MTVRHAESATDTRERLEREAEAVRARLESRIDEVKERGRQATHFIEVAKRQATRHAPALIAVGAVALLLTTVLTIRKRARDRRRERRDALLSIAGSLLRPGYSVQPMEPKPGFIKTTLQNAGKELLTTAAHELGRRALAELSLVPVADAAAKPPTPSQPAA